MDQLSPTDNVIPFPAGRDDVQPETARLIRLGPIELDERHLIKHIKDDLVDDWFPDPLLYRDMTKRGVLSECLMSNFEANHGAYKASERDEYNVPKPNFTLRYALETTFPDRALYQGLAEFLKPFFDLPLSRSIIPWNVFNNRVTPAVPGRKKALGGGVEAWKNFHGVARSALVEKSRGNPHAALLSTDVSAYYENIDLSILKRTLLSLLPELEAPGHQKYQIRAHTQLLFDCLKSWSYDGMRGLPQNRDASSFLGNLYMHPVDKAMHEKGYGQSYFRYMDDIKIACDDEFSARRALQDLSLSLRAIGLTLNSKKTEICLASDTPSVDRCLEEVADELQTIDAMWRTKSASVLTRSLPYLAEFTLTTARKGAFDGKNFRFCINKLRKLAICTDFAVPNRYFAPLTPEVVKGIDRCPSSTHTLVQYLSAVPLTSPDLDAVSAHLLDPKRCVYDWQDYYLWSLLGQKRHRTLDLMARAEEHVCSGGDTPARAAASLYLGVVGDTSRRLLVAEHFKTLSTSLGQRCALIAIHELSREQTQNQIRGNVRPELTKLYSVSRDAKGTYFAPPGRIQLVDLIDSDSPYE